MPDLTSKAPARSRKVILVPHGFQPHYTIGFSNGVAANGEAVTLIGHDSIDRRQLHQSIDYVNLRGSQDETRNAAGKAINLLKYHVRLLTYLITHPGNAVHLTGLIGYEISVGILENLLIRMSSHRLILTVHNILPHDRHTTWKRFVYRLIYKIPHYLIVHTEIMKAELVQKYALSADKILVMQHGLNDIYYSTSTTKNEARSLLGIAEDKLVLLFFGSILPYKGLDILLRVFRDLGRDVHLVIAGRPGTPEYSREILNTISRLDNKSQVTLHNRYIDDAEIPVYFMASDVVVMPYRHIDQSGVLFLAFRFGLPVIAFDVGSLSSYITNETGVLVRTISEDELRIAIERFKMNKEKYSQDKVIAASKKFEWKNTVKPILWVYDIRPVRSGQVDSHGL